MYMLRNDFYYYHIILLLISNNASSIHSHVAAFDYGLEQFTCFAVTFVPHRAANFDIEQFPTIDIFAMTLNI